MTSSSPFSSTPSLEQPESSFDLPESSFNLPQNQNEGSSSLLLLPPSPIGSESSLTSDETTFDHLASIPNSKSKNVNSINNEENSKAPILGLRDLIKMHKNEKQKLKLNKKNDNENNNNHNNSLIPISRSNEIIEIHNELPPSYFNIGRNENENEINEQEIIFAKQVIIKGWKIIGGDDWKDVAKLGSYVVYDINIFLINGGTIEILKRYTDFVNLRNSLKIKYPSLKDAIPKLPSKAHFSKFSKEFLEQRQPRLQRFLRCVILHPEMGKGGKNSIVGQWIIGK
ncbi:uncharacterized protein I206_102387 [Kwoniella pini CBS 10737]|uniref:Endosomal/vacuolar adapter protein YPT35 n=1 Tax=Kwoniella pini CBS 10737 TaxID=1296096 RepID=A0A1B9I577_9TREE|nr:uncharacterized protein I206_02734 [Kwoniella pini CBS 10737]OCF50679.1 hypothetical protein I206_02734 [Kwoniella pini CBS 10737]